MKILFSPSESKCTGGIAVAIDKKNYLFPELYSKRLEIITHYENYVSQAGNEQLIKLFGTKKQKVIEYYSHDIFTRDTMKVIERYNGVAYGYLDYASLNKQQKLYIDGNTVIFSNLFGPLLAGDRGLPDYKLKQGQKIGELPPEKVYKMHFSDALDALLVGEHYLDLRAGFYHKFYKPKSPYTTLKFLKKGKIVTHWTKAYRGLMLRELAIQNIQTIEEFMTMGLETLDIVDIIEKGIHREVIYEDRE